MKVEKVCNCDTSFQEKDQNGRFKAILLATLTMTRKTAEVSKKASFCCSRGKVIDVFG